MTKDYLTLFADKLKLNPIIIGGDMSCVDYLTNELEKFGEYVLDVPSRDLYVDVTKNTITLVECTDVEDTPHITIQIDSISFSGYIISLNLSTISALGDITIIVLEDLDLGYIR